MQKVISQNEYFNYYRNSIDNVSHWYPKIKDCGVNVPNTIIFKLSNFMIKWLLPDDKQKSLNRIIRYTKRHVIKELRQNGMSFLYIKDGTTYDRLHFGFVIASDTFDIAMKIFNTFWFDKEHNHQGITELVISDFIGLDSYVNNNFCFTNKLPLRPSFKVLYDFDTNEIVGIYNPWVKEFVSNEIKNVNNNIVYEEAYPYLEGIYSNYKDDVRKELIEKLKDVNLYGRWLINVLYNEDDGKLWITKMKSTYKI